MPDAFYARMTQAGARFRSLDAALGRGDPWPLAERFDHAPEAAWGPPEILAHLEEMLQYWYGEMERVVTMTDGPKPFGRVATDQVRLAIIERDRTLPITELMARVGNGIERWRRRWVDLIDSERDRTGIHPTLGELSVSDLASRFVATHLDDHLDQLEAALT
jgi:hypothetical protein